METPGHHKPAGYFEQDRAELVRLLPEPLGRVLDVGCGEGATGRSLREAGADWISGVELDPVEEQLDRLSRPFDTILAYDVLEHLVDPWRLLHRLHGVAAPGARIHVSVPNARHWTLLRDLILRGTFGYTPAEHRDVTHLRWFTRRDLIDLLESTGWGVATVDFGRLRPVSRLAAKLTWGRSPEFLAYQLSALARRP